jgi:hypothetical protein
MPSEQTLGYQESFPFQDHVHGVTMIEGMNFLVTALEPKAPDESDGREIAMSHDPKGLVPTMTIVLLFPG